MGGGAIYQWGGGNRAKIAGFRFHLEETDTRLSRLPYESKASMFELRAKREIKAELRRALKCEV